MKLPWWLTNGSPPSKPTLRLAVGLNGTVSNPPSTTPTSPLTKPISVTSAVELFRHGYTSRETLMSIPAFRKSIMLIAGVAGGLPYHAYNSDNERIPNAFLEQPEVEGGYTRNVTFTRIATDLLLEGSALLLITSHYADGFPKSAQYVPFNEWSQDPRTNDVIYEGQKLAANRVCKFDSPWSGLTHDAAPTVAMLNKLRAITFRYLDNPQAREFFKASEAGQDPDPDDVESFLSAWEQARRDGITAFIPPGVTLEQLKQMSPEELMLNLAQEFAIAEVARLTGVDSAKLDLNITTRQYTNLIDSRRDFIDFTCSWLISSIEQRLSLNDIVPRGTYVRCSLDAFLRSNTLDRYQAHQIGLQNQFLTVDEVRYMERRPALNEETTND